MKTGQGSVLLFSILAMLGGEHDQLKMVVNCFQFYMTFDRTIKMYKLKDIYMLRMLNDLFCPSGTFFF